MPTVCTGSFPNRKCVEMAESAPAIDINDPKVAAAIVLGLFGVVIAWAFLKLPEALDSTKNNRGIAQWSSLFYRKGGPITDFINGLPYILNLLPTATVYLGIYLRQVCVCVCVSAGT